MDTDLTALANEDLTWVMGTTAPWPTTLPGTAV